MSNTKSSQLKAKSSRGGYTFFEIMVVIGITVIFGSVALLNLPTGLRSKLEIENAMGNLRNHLILVQQRAISQENGAKWGIHIDASIPGQHFYQIFYGDSYETGTIVETVYLPDGMVFLSPAQGNTEDIIFEKVTGRTEDGHSIVIGLESVAENPQLDCDIQNCISMLIPPGISFPGLSDVIPPLDTSINLDPNSATVQPGGSAVTTVTVNVLSGVPELTAFSVSGLPPGTTAGFSPVSCSPTCTSNLTLQTAQGTPDGTHLLTISENSGASQNEATFSLAVNTISEPGAPVNLLPVGGSGQVSLTWESPTFTGGSPITNYKIYRSMVSGGEVSVGNAGAILSYVDSGLNNGTTYYYKVSAENAVGEGPLSIEANVTLSATAPSAPANLTGTPGTGQATLDWTASSPNGSALTAYRIYRSDTSGGTLTQVGTVGGSTLTYTNTGLSNGSTYYYKISAVNGIGESGLSNEAIVVIPAIPPGAPTGLTGTAGDSQVTLNWTAPASNGGSAITEYKIYRSATSGGTLTQVGTVNGSTLTFTNTGLTNGTTYYYKVSAKNSIGEGVLSGERSVMPAGVPSAPTLTSVTGLSARASVKWQTPSSNGGYAITGYKIYRGASSGSEAYLATTGVVNQYTDSTVVNGTTYYYKVLAINSVGDGSLSNGLSATPGNFSSVFISSTGYNGNLGGLTGADAKCQTAADTSGIGGTWKAWLSDEIINVADRLVHSSAPYLNMAGEKVADNWTDLTDNSLDIAIAYNEFGASKSGQAWTGSYATGAKYFSQDCSRWTSLTGSGGDAGLAGLVTSNSSTWSFFGSNSCGTSLPLYCFEQIPQAPDVPTNLSATSGNSQVTLNWTAPASNGGSAITEYKIYRSATSGGTLTQVGTVNGSTLTFTNTGLTNGTTYYYKVSAKNSIGEGVLSGERSVMPAGVPSAPTLTSVTGLSARASVKWQTPSSNGGYAITGYKIYRGASSGSEAYLATTGVVNQYTDSTVVNGTTYYYQVSAVNAIGEGPRSAENSGTLPLRVFVTSTRYNGNLGGLYGADLKCASRADAASLGGNWKAWLSDSVTSAASRIFQSSGAYKLLNGTIIADNWTDLTDGVLAAAININENGAIDVYAEYVYTNTKIDGSIYSTQPPPSGIHCDNWTSSAYTGYYRVGGSGYATDSGWTTERRNTRCGPYQSYNLYCFEQRLSDIPSAPLNLAASISDQQVVLNWQAPTSNGGSTITNYKIYRGTTPGGETLLTTIGNVLTYSDIVIDSSNIYYKILAVNGVGEGPYSSEVGITTFISLSASPSAGGAVPGNAVSSVVTANTQGNPNTITFSAAGLPAGATASFDPTDCNANPNCSSTLTINTTQSTPVGSYSITITGTSDRYGSKNGTYQFNVLLPASASYRRVFVTSTETKCDFGGLTHADNICQYRANDTSLGGSWKAWLSKDNTYGPVIHAKDRLTHAVVPYRRLDNTLIANNWNDLVDGTPISALINLTESGSFLSTRVWTATDKQGNYSDPGYNTCDGWTSYGGGAMATYGESNFGNDHWTITGFRDQGDSNNSFYCFEQ